MAESLLLKFLMAYGTTKGRDIAQRLALPLKDTKELLAGMKNQQWVYYKDAGQLDFSYALTDAGRDRARKS